MTNRTRILLLAALMVTGVMALNGVDALEETLLYTYSVGSTVSADIKLEDIYGKEYSFEDFRGKVVFVHFWSVVCPVVKNYERKFIALQREFSGKDVVQIAINSHQKELKGDYANLRAYVSKAGLNFPVTVDRGHEISDLFGAMVSPQCFVIDKGGVIRYIGAFDDDIEGSKGANAKSHVRDAIVALLAGKSVPVARTRPYGCAIKAPD